MENELSFKEQALSIKGPAGQIEAVCLAPEALAAAVPLAVICHPHPLHGGAMQNKVVTTLAKAFQKSGIASIRFNFRGVGASEGQYDQARGEVDDCLAVVEWARSHYPQAMPPVLAGFSFGSFVAYQAASRIDCRLLVAVAPPVHHFPFDQTPEPSCPWLVMQPDADEVVPPAQVYDFVSARTHQPQLIRFAETSHFFHGKLVNFREALIEYLRDHAK
jgi:uncharacterized protein